VLHYASVLWNSEPSILCSSRRVEKLDGFENLQWLPVPTTTCIKYKNIKGFLNENYIRVEHFLPNISLNVFLPNKL
jgi:hypothetical protein